MKPLPALIVLATVLAWLPPAAAQAPRADTGPSLAQTERKAADLKQGMSADDVQKLLGKPRRTALKNGGAVANGAPQGTLQWTYAWTDSSKGSLRIDFAPNATPAEWRVTAWEWSAY